MHKIFKYMMQTSDAIVLRENTQYLDPIAICESLHAGPSWYKDNDDILKLYKTCKEKHEA